MASQRKQSFLHGALILAAATVLVKIIGAIFKIPLTSLIGESGMGYFNSSYYIFNIAYTLSIAGFPVAIAKLVAERAAKRRYKDIKRILRMATLLFFVTGIVGTCIMLFGAKPFARIIGNPNSYIAIMAMAPTIFFGCIMSIYRGYYEGLRNMYPTAFSQVIEALGKLIFGYTLAFIFLKIGSDQYTSTGKVFGKVYETPDEAKNMILAYAAAGAILGIAISTFFGMLYVYFRHKLKGDGITKQEVRESVPAESSKIILKRLILIAIPVCLSSLVINLTSIIDLGSLMHRMNTALEADRSAFLGAFHGLVPETMNDIPNYLFGIYSGMAMTLFNIIPALTTTFAISALPTVTSCWTVKDRKGTKRNIESIIRVTTMVSIPAGFGLCVLAEPILKLLYSNRINGAMIAVPMLRFLGIAAIFLSIATPIFSILQAVGKTYLPVKIMFFGGLIKLTMNFFLVAIPSLNIYGAPISSFTCYLFIVLASLFSLMRVTHVIPNFNSVFFKPILAGAFCAVTAFVSYSLLGKLEFLNFKISLIISIGLAGCVYVVVLLLIKGISRDDVTMLPKGEKIAKVLEKYNLIS